MEREQVIRAPKAHEQELRAAGVVSVSLLGSIARGENPAHDVYVVVRLRDIVENEPSSATPRELIIGR